MTPFEIWIRDNAAYLDPEVHTALNETIRIVNGCRVWLHDNCTGDIKPEDAVAMADLVMTRANYLRLKHGSGG